MFVGDINLALNKPAYQISTLAGGVAGRAVDENSNTSVMIRQVILKFLGT